jgi:hypothetical protein
MTPARSKSPRLNCAGRVCSWLLNAISAGAHAPAQPRQMDVSSCLDSSSFLVCCSVV